ncbi:lysophosphatidic acid receptor 5-like, partial [Cetorhinus maximus]
MMNESLPAVCEGKTISACTDHEALHHLLLAGNAAIFIAGLSLNAAALAIFLRSFRFTSCTVVYMTNLAACDLLFSLALPLRLYYYATHAWPLGDLLCQAAGSLFQINLSGSCLFLACINVDRLLALAYPLRSRALRRPRVAWRVCALVWLVILLGSLPVALAHDTSCCRPAGGAGAVVRCFESFSNRTWRKELKPLVLAQFGLGFLPPLALVLYCSSRVLYQLCRLPRSEASAARRRKAVRLLAVNATIFVACFLPYNVALVSYASLKTDGRGPTETERVARLVLQVTTLLASANCGLDPLVYYFSTEGFRNTLRAGSWTLAGPSWRTTKRWFSAKSA